MPSDCIVTGTLLDSENNPKSGVRLTITPISVSGALVWSGSFQTAPSDVNGLVSFVCIQGGRFNIRGNALEFTGTGMDVTIPASSSATLESFVAGAAYTIAGLTVFGPSGALSGLYTTLKLLGDVTVVAESPGVASATFTGAGGGGTFASLSDVTFTALASGHFPRYNGTEWVNAALVAGDMPTGIDALKIGGGLVSNAEFAFLDGVSSAIQGQIDGKQASLGFTAENQANKATGFGTLNNTLYPTTAAVAAAFQPLHANLTQLAALTDPNADRLLFWDDSAGEYKHLTLGTNLSITDTTINAAGGASFPLLAPDGTAAAPSYGFSGIAAGMFNSGTYGLGFSYSGAIKFALGSRAYFLGGVDLAVGPFAGIRWNGASDLLSGYVLGIDRNANGVAEINNSNLGQWGALLCGTRDAGTNTVTNGLTIGHQSTGTPTTGLGAALLINLNSSTTADQNAAQVAAIWNTATHASRSADFSVSLVHNAAALAEALRVKSDTRLLFGVPNSAPTDGDISNNFATGYLNQAGNELKFRVRYSDGTYKTATLALT